MGASTDMNELIRAAAGARFPAAVATTPPPPPPTTANAGAGAGLSQERPPDMDAAIRAFARRGSSPLWQ